MGDDTPIDRMLACIAGFYAREADGLNALRQLRHAHGLLPSQVLLLHPGDARLMRFGRLARRWRDSLDLGTRCATMDRWLAACSGAVLGALAATAWMLSDAGLPDSEQMLMLLLATALGAVRGAAATGRWARSPRPDRFNGNVRQQLARGCWAVVAHDVPWTRQAGVVSLLRAGSDKWCAVAPRSARI